MYEILINRATHTHTHTHAYIYMCAYTCIHIYVCIYKHIHYYLAEGNRANHLKIRQGILLHGNNHDKIRLCIHKHQAPSIHVHNYYAGSDPGEGATGPILIYSITLYSGTLVVFLYKIIIYTKIIKCTILDNNAGVSITVQLVHTIFKALICA